MILSAKKGLILGALDENSIAWKVAEQARLQGADLILSNTAMAIRMGKINELGERLGAPVIAADATSVEDLEDLWKASMKHFNGSIDFVLHSVGMSPNVRKRIPYYELDYNNLNKTLDVSAISFHKLLQTAWQLDAISEGGSALALSYIAAQRTFSGYNDMAEAKALLESIARSFGYHYGRRKKVRVNTVSQAPTPTTAGSSVSGFDDLFTFSDKLAPLGNPDADACAAYCLTLFSDMARGVTMQNLFHDGGYSSMGMSEDLMQEIEKCLMKK
jgi:enoyl-[acyl-carrier protein] reductase I